MYGPVVREDTGPFQFVTCLPAEAGQNLLADEGEVGRDTAFAQGLCLVARAGPCLVGRAPVERRLCLPLERLVGAAVQQRPVDIGVDVRGEAEACAGLHHPREAVEIDLADEAALPVALLRPRIWVKQVDA